jgi:hypothetical protein
MAKWHQHGVKIMAYESEISAAIIIVMAKYEKKKENEIWRNE